MSRFAEFATPDISDLLNRLYAVDPSIRCLTPGRSQLIGPACTVKVFPGDNLMVHKSLDVARPGDVVVIDAGSSPMNAVLGDIISTKARHRRIAGFVVDGLVRDLAGIAELDLPVFARGTTPVGPLHRGPGEINYPIACGGVVTNPGDVVVADRDGIVIVPRNIAEELLDRLEAQRAAAEAYLASVQQGVFSNEWVDRLLSAADCPIVKPEFGWHDADPPAEPVSGGPPVDGPLAPNANSSIC
ncbi:MAG: RraA family protein [Planctomycetota bacterium]